MSELLLSPEIQRQRAVQAAVFNMKFDMQWALFQQLVVVDYENAVGDQRRESKSGKPAAIKFDPSTAARAAKIACNRFMELNGPQTSEKDKDEAGEIRKDVEQAAKPAEAPAPTAEAAAAPASSIVLP